MQTHPLPLLSPESVRRGNEPLTTLRQLYRARFLDVKMAHLARQSKGSTFHVSNEGHELVGVLCGQALIPEVDWAFPYYRDRALALGLGCSLKELLMASLAREGTHHSGGRMMGDHFSHRRLNIPCQSSVVGSQFLQAVGVAKGARLSKTDEVVYVSSGEGATSQGDFYEALNYTCLHRLNIIFMIQDNGWAISVPRAQQTAGGSIARLIQGYPSLSIYEVDGSCYEESSMAIVDAVSRGRRGEGGSVIVARVPRLGPHSSSDDPKKYQTASTIEEERKKDPLPLFEHWLLTNELITLEEMERVKGRVKEEVDAAAEEAETQPSQDAKKVLCHLYVDDFSDRIEEESQRGQEAVMVDGLNHALHEEMERDERVLLFGQDVADGKGGVFGVSRGLSKRFGEARCFNTPLAESTIIGTAVGLSLYGFKPVAEIQFADYMWTGANQLFNELATLHYRSNGEWHCPLVIRMPVGGYIQGGPYHSQSVEAFLCHIPGFIVLMPSNAADAKMLLKSAIRNPNPVIFLEHKALYRQRLFSSRLEPTQEEVLPFGKAHRVSEGEDITVVCWGVMVSMAVEVATAMRIEGIGVEVIDLRSLNPLDTETVIDSVKKTNRLLVLQEAPLNCGLGAEIAVRIGDQAFAYLDGPIKRIGGLDICTPYAKPLEECALPRKQQVKQSIRTLVAY